MSATGEFKRIKRARRVDRVRRIQAAGVLAAFDYDITFDNDPDSARMRLIYAPNGRGKTNFLRAVNFALNPTPDALQALVEIPIKNLQVDFSPGSYIALDRETAFTGSFTISVSTDEGSASVHVDPSDFAGRLYRRVWGERDDYAEFEQLVSNVSPGGVLIGDDRLAPLLDESRDLPRAGEARTAVARRKGVNVVSQLLERVERMLTRSAFAGLSREYAASGVYAQIARTTLSGETSVSTVANAVAARTALEAEIGGLLVDGASYEAYGLLTLHQLRDIRDQVGEARANSRHLTTLYRLLNPYLESIRDTIESLEPTQRKIDTFVTAVNHFLDRKELRFSTETGIELYGRDDKKLDPESLSSGERHLLYLVSMAVLATDGNPLVIIDEPELSLGIEWQRDLLAELLRCTAPSRVQFLIASHSVQIMSGLPGADIVVPSEDAEDSA
jgi:energy-coupling factor transporter ATP-binding protein EcfA2